MLNLKNVLMVDDETNILEVYGRIMRDYFKDRAEILAANSSSEGMKLFREHAIHVVISDIMRPEMSGDEFCRIVKKENPKLKIMIYTLSGSEEATNSLLRDGVADVVLRKGSGNLFVSMLDMMKGHGKKDDEVSRRMEGLLEKLSEEKYGNNRSYHWTTPEEFLQAVESLL